MEGESNYTLYNINKCCWLTFISFFKVSGDITYFWPILLKCDCTCSTNSDMLGLIIIITIIIIIIMIIIIAFIYTR